MKTVTALVIVVFAIGGCVRPTVHAPDTMGVLVVTLTQMSGETVIKTESISSRPFTVPRRPGLPRLVMPYALFPNGSLSHAGSARKSDYESLLFTITEDPFMRTANVNAIPISEQAPEYQSLVQGGIPENTSCVATTGFFIKGMAGPPREPIRLTTRQGDRWGAIVVDPKLHTLNLRPVLRVTLDRFDLPTEMLTPVSVASGGLDFVIIGVTTAPDGYRVLGFSSSRRQGGWNNVPGDRETVFYALDDRTAVQSTCRHGRLVMPSASGR